MASYNRVIIMGNLTRDPEYKQLASGQTVCRLGLASNRQFKNKQTGTMVQEVCFVDIDVWGAQADSCHQYLQKGRSVLVEGRLKLDTWEDQNGGRRSKHSIVADRIVFLSNQAAEEGASASSFGRQEPKNDVEQELMNKLDQIQKKVQTEDVAPEAKPIRQKAAPKVQAAAENMETTAKAKSSGEVDFKDEPPFEDDLPF